MAAQLACLATWTPRAPTTAERLAPILEIQGPEDLPLVGDHAVPASRERIGEMLLATGLVTPQGLGEALSTQARCPGRRLGWILQMLGHLQQRQLDRVLAARAGFACVSLREFQPRPGYVQRLPVNTALRYGIALLHEDARVAWVAFADPLDTRTREIASFILGRRIVALQADRSEIEAFYRRRDSSLELARGLYYDTPQRRRAEGFAGSARGEGTAQPLELVR